MRHLAIALVLACVLSGTVSAGEIPTTSATAPQPPPCPVVAAGEIHTTSATATGESSTVLTLILTLLSVVS